MLVHDLHIDSHYALPLCMNLFPGFCKANFHSNCSTSISFFKKLAGRLASTISLTPMTIIPHMMAYVSVFTKLTSMTRYFSNLVSLRTVEVTSVAYTSNMCHGLCFLTVTFILYFSTF